VVLTARKARIWVSVIAIGPSGGRGRQLRSRFNTEG
jgi:hypothetical protein